MVRCCLAADMKHRPSPIPWLDRRGVKLTPTGNDRYRLACPVHGASTQTMGISRVDGTWLANCFSCHFTGDAISLVMAVLSCSFKSALAEFDLKLSDLRSKSSTQLWKKSCTVVACDVPGCGNTIESEHRQYKTPGKMGVIWSMSSEQSALFRAELHGWWIGLDGEHAICGSHMVRSVPGATWGRAKPVERRQRSEAASTGHGLKGNREPAAAECAFSGAGAKYGSSKGCRAPESGGRQRPVSDRGPRLEPQRMPHAGAGTPVDLGNCARTGSVPRQI